MGVRVMSESRRYPRKNMFFSASLASREDRSVCDILNMSAGGARIRLDDQITGIGQPGLVLTIDDYGDIPARLVWQNGYDVGLKFDGDPRRLHDQTMAMALFDQD